MVARRETVLITGSGSGIGAATARLFLERGWQVAATMRDLDKASEWSSEPNCAVLRLDVTEPGAPERVVEETLSRFGGLDVVINNAAFSPQGSFEGLEPAEIHRAFDVNVFGAMAVARAALPHLRARQSGQIVNVGSGITHAVMPFSAPYAASKSALEAFSKALWYELTPLGIRVKHAVLGTFDTGFGVEGRADPALDPEAYRDRIEHATAFGQRILKNAPPAGKAAAGLYRIVRLKGRRVVYTVGADARFAVMAGVVPFHVFGGIARRFTGA